MITRRSLLLLPLLILGCRGQKGAPDLGEMIPTVAGQIADTLLPPPSRSLSNTPADPPLLGSNSKTCVILAADEAAFVSILRDKVSPKDVSSVVKKVNEELGRLLKRRRFESLTSPFPPHANEADATKAVLAAVTPFTMETGSPDDKAKGKSQILLMARLQITDAKTGQTLAQREFYSGYTLPPVR